MVNPIFQIQSLNLKSKSKSFAILVLVLSFWFCVLRFPVNAQQVSLSISPPLLEVIIKPDKSIMIAYKIGNHGDPVYLNARLVNFEPRDNLGNIKLKNDLTGPIRFSLDNADRELERPFFLKTGESQQLLLRIRAPEGAPEGDYYYTLLAETLPPTSIDGIVTSRAKTTIGSNILITVTESGVVEVKPRVVLFDFLSNLNIFGQKLRIFDSFDNVPLVFIVENKGKNMIKPEGKINLTGNFGEKQQFDVVPKNILSDSQRLIEATPSAQTTFNNKPVSLLLSGFFIGYYRLSTQLTFGENSPTIFASNNFFAFPFRLTFGIIVVVIISVMIIKRFSKDDDEE